MGKWHPVYIGVAKWRDTVGPKDSPVEELERALEEITSYRYKLRICSGLIYGIKNWDYKEDIFVVKFKSGRDAAHFKLKYADVLQEPSQKTLTKPKNLR